MTPIEAAQAIHSLTEKIKPMAESIQKAGYLTGSGPEFRRSLLVVELADINNKFTNNPIHMICKKKLRSTAPYKKCKVSGK